MRNTYKLLLSILFTGLIPMASVAQTVQLVKDVQPGPGSGGCAQLILVGNQLFFEADDGTTGFELWKSDGTESGTMLVKDIRPGFSSPFLSELTELNGNLFFKANDAINGTEIWVSDGTETGTDILYYCLS